MFRIFKKCYNFRANPDGDTEINITVYPEVYQTYNEARVAMERMRKNAGKEFILALKDEYITIHTGKYHKFSSGLLQETCYFNIGRDDQISLY